MLNIREFTLRLKKILEYYELNASTFAEKIEVQRSSISHILSGRNKPSLDFILKITKQFSEVDLYWLLFNQGNFPKSKKIEEDFPSTLFSEINQKSVISEKKENDIVQSSIDSSNLKQFSNNEVEKIVLFYKDGSFKDYFKR